MAKTATCGWCKKAGIKVIQMSAIRNGAPTNLRGTELEAHSIPASLNIPCKGLETYLILDGSGRPARS